jgi:hypothetical protein
VRSSSFAYKIEICRDAERNLDLLTWETEMNNEMNTKIKTVFPAGVIIEHVDADAMKAVIDAIWWEAVDYPYLRAAELSRSRYALIDTELIKILDWKA